MKKQNKIEHSKYNIVEVDKKPKEIISSYEYKGEEVENAIKKFEQKVGQSILETATIYVNKKDKSIYIVDKKHIKPRAR